MQKWIILIGITILSLGVRFWGLSHPREVVFDEVHYGSFLTAYCCTHKNFFDIHPPHGKLLLAAGAKLGNYSEPFSFAAIGRNYEKTPIEWMRAVPALLGGLIAPLVTGILLISGVSLAFSSFGGFLIALDNGFITQSKFLLLDGMMIFWMLFGIFFALLSLKRHPQNLWLVILAGIGAGISVGVKFSGLVTPALIVCLFAWQDWRLRTLNFQRWIYFLLSFGFIYLLGWWFHFFLLTEPGPGDAFLKLSGSFWSDLIATHKQMFIQNATLTIPHSDAASWWQWPTMNQPIYYWSSGKADIYFVGNPIIWWGASFLFIALLAGFMIKTERQKIKERFFTSPFTWFAIVGFVLSYAPYITMQRFLFMYYFMQSLVFILIGLIIWWDKELSLASQKNRTTLLIGASCLVISGYLLVAPLTYGWSEDFLWGHVFLKWFPNWK